MISKHKNPNTIQTPYVIVALYIFFSFFLIPFLLSLCHFSLFNTISCHHHRRRNLHFSLNHALAITDDHRRYLLRQNRLGVRCEGGDEVGSDFFISISSEFSFAWSFPVMTRWWWKRVSSEREKRTYAATRSDLNEFRRWRGRRY